MALSVDTIHKLAKALSPEVVDYILKDERYAEFMMEMIPEAIQNCMGDLDMDVCHDIAFCVLDSVSLEVMK